MKTFCGNFRILLRPLPRQVSDGADIVVPIFVRKKLAAELDAESYSANTFTNSEHDFVEACAAVVRKYLGAP